MQSAEEVRKDVILEALKFNLESEGLEVFVRPSRAILPRFTDLHRPDAIALSADRKIVIDVVVAPGQPPGSAPALRDVLRDHPGWQHLVYYAPTQPTAAGIAPSGQSSEGMKTWGVCLGGQAHAPVFSAQAPQTPRHHLG